MTDDLAPKAPFGSLTYGSYLKVPELLELQAPLVADKSHDELLFIIIHQAYELWFKQILFELDTVARLVVNGDYAEARRLVDRVTVIEKVLVEQIHILETMTPRDFLHFRKALTPASGFQSVQFREVEFLCGMKNPRYLLYLPEGSAERTRLQKRLDAPSLRRLLDERLVSEGFGIIVEAEPGSEPFNESARALMQVYHDPEDHLLLYNLFESLVAHDQWLGIWRYHHVRVVERVIGSKPGTGGSPGIPYLESTLSKRAFPLLWAARALLSDETLFMQYQPPVSGD